MSKLVQWRARLGFVAIAAVFAVAACGDDDGGGSTGDESPPPTVAEGERRQGGELVIQALEPGSLDPHFSSFTADIHLQRAIWRGLYHLNAENEPLPSMAAAAPEISGDGLTYTIELRDGLLWSDGEPLTAQNFEDGIKRTCNPVVASEYQFVLTNVVGCDDHFINEAGFDQALEDAIGVTAVDDKSLEITLSSPQPSFTTVLSLWMTYPLPSHLFPTTGDTWPTDPTALAYNGPYILTEFVPQDHHTLEPNPNWAAPDGIEPTLEKITAKYIGELSQATNAYRTDEIKFTPVDVTQLESIQSEFPDEYLKFLHASTRVLFMQLEAPPLDILEFRLALSQAIDRAELNRVVAQDGNEPTTSWVPEVDGGHAPNEFDDEVGFNPEEARANFAAAQEEFGAGLPALTILSSDNPITIATAQFLQNSFKTVLGYDVEIEQLDSATRSDRFSNKQFELFPGAFSHDYPGPDSWILGLFESGGAINNWSCNDPDIDTLVEEAGSTNDDSERRAKFKEVNELIVTRVCGVAAYWHENDHWLVKPDVVGMKENISGNDFGAPGDWNMEAWGLRAE